MSSTPNEDTGFFTISNIHAFVQLHGADLLDLVFCTDFQMRPRRQLTGNWKTVIQWGDERYSDRGKLKNPTAGVWSIQENLDTGARTLTFDRSCTLVATVKPKQNRYLLSEDKLARKEK